MKFIIYTGVLLWGLWVICGFLEDLHWRKRLKHWANGFTAH